jgi:ABC-type protease/lipase transport system fused ATPase/permease subunit
MFRNSAKSTTLISEALKATRPGFLTSTFFSLFINVLAFVCPLYMLQIYDRVITSRNVTTLIALTVIAVFLVVIYALLEKNQISYTGQGGYSFL